MNTAAKSRASSEPTRPMRRAVSQRSRNESTGGRLRRTSYSTSCSATGASRGVGSLEGPMPGINVPGRPGSRGWTGGPATGLRRHPHEDVDAGLVDRAAQAFAQVDLGLPGQEVAGAADVRPADLGVVRGQRLVDDLRRAAGDLDDGLGQLEERELRGVADVDRVVLAGLGQRDDPADEVVDVAERAGLAAVA